MCLCETNCLAAALVLAKPSLYTTLSNLEVVNIPSYLLKAGDVVAVREKSKSLDVVADALLSRANYEWLQFNDEKKEGIFLSAPERIQIPEDIKENLIVELYSK